MRELSVCKEEIFALAKEKTIKRRKRRKRILAATVCLCLCSIIAMVGFFSLNAEPTVITAADLESKSGNIEEMLKTDLQRALEKYEGKKVLFRVTISVEKGSISSDSDAAANKPSFTDDSCLETELEGLAESLNVLEDRRVYIAELEAEEIEKLLKTGYYTIRLSEK